jgi:hypothetical protein
MGTPSVPLGLQCLDRVIEVVKGIVGGSVYWYSVGDKVLKGLRVYTEAPGYPCDFVYFGADFRDTEYLPDLHIHRYVTIIVAGFVDEEGGESTTRLWKHIRDVRLAIETDLRSTAVGSLGNLVGWGHLAGVVTDEGELGLDGVAGFRQDVHLCLDGDEGTI